MFEMIEIQVCNDHILKAFDVILMLLDPVGMLTGPTVKPPPLSYSCCYVAFQCEVRQLHCIYNAVQLEEMPHELDATTYNGLEAAAVHGY